MNHPTWNKPLKFFLILILIAPCLTGCWDRLEIEERAVILGIAVDDAGKSAEQTEPKVTHLEESFPIPPVDMVRITVQIAVPGRIPLGPVEGGSSGGVKPVWVLSAVGHTIDDALSVLQEELADRIFLGHLRVIVVSEKIARKGLSNLNDYLRRNPEVRRLAWLMVSKGNAAEIMNAEPELERVPSLYLIAMMDHAVEMGIYPFEFLGVFWSEETSLGHEPSLPYIVVR